MITTGRYSKHEEIKPEEPFLKDIVKDIKLIEASYLKSVAKEIKMKMINELLNSI